MPFPPVPVYPAAIDSDYTLFLVHNTTEAKLSADNSPWSQEIEIVPVASDRSDVWASNGFGNIEGELFYYDCVEKNSDGKVVKLKGCERNLGGDKTKFNRRGTWVRSFVVAEHHNQIVDGILNVQNFIGYNFDDRQGTLDWRIRNLQELQVIFDDHSCPDVNFTWNILEDDPITGVLASYVVEITAPTTINNFRLDFGDGDFTTSELTGTHRYALNATIDPVVRVSNDRCQIVQTPIERENPIEPPPEIVEQFDFPIPEFPDVPDFTFVPYEVPEPDINLPPLAVPCISIEGQIGPIPSLILGPDINMVSNVTIVTNNPVQILHSVVTITGGENIPSLIIIDPPIPPTIIIDPPIPPTIVIVPPQSNITLDLNLTDLPRFEMDWGQMPRMEVEMTMAKMVRTPRRYAADPEISNAFGEEFSDLFEVSDQMDVSYEPAGIPSEIMVIWPDKSDIKIDSGDLFERSIKVDASGVNLPTDIQIHGPESPIPTSISFGAHDLPAEIKLVYSGTPIEIMGVPQTIELTHNLPERIVIDMPKPIPDRIIIESNLPDRIFLDGPSSIPIHIPEDVFLPVKFPDVLPEVKMAWNGVPVEVKITLDEIISKNHDGQNLFTIVPAKC